MAKIYFISPHLDDAILSCGWQITRHVDAGDDVEVISVFTEGDKKVHAIRRQEDIAACAMLKIRPVHVGFLDAPFRNNRYADIKQIVFGVMDDQDRQCIRDIVSIIENLIAQGKPDKIYVPLAAGNHIDHRLVWEASQLFSQEGTIFYYEDRPYVIWPGILDTRLNEIGVVREASSVTVNDMALAIDKHYFLRAFVPHGPVRDECLPLYIRNLEQSKMSFQPQRSVEFIDLFANESDLRKSWLALELYRSQIRFIYKSFLDYYGDAPYRERYWQFQRI